MSDHPISYSLVFQRVFAVSQRSFVWNHSTENILDVVAVNSLTILSTAIQNPLKTVGNLWCLVFCDVELTNSGLCINILFPCIHLPQQRQVRICWLHHLKKQSIEYLFSFLFCLAALKAQWSEKYKLER
jgi:hypothetical protein